MENRKRMIKTITAAELINGRTFDRTIIDIRPAEEYKKGSMDAALNIPEDKLVEYLENPEEADMESGTIGEGKAWEEGVNVGKLLAAIPKVSEALLVIPFDISSGLIAVTEPVKSFFLARP